MSDVYIHGEVKAVTAHAILLKVDSIDWRGAKMEDGPEVWIPKSQIKECTYEVDALDRNDVIDFVIPNWLATEKDLIA